MPTNEVMVEVPLTKTLDAVKNPTVEIPPVILNPVPTRLSAIVIVAPAPDAVATILPPTKFSDVTLPAVPSVVPSSLMVIPLTPPTADILTH